MAADEQKKQTRKKLRPKSWKQRFVAALKDHGQVTAAAKLANVSLATAYEHKKADPEFAAAWEAAREEATDEMVIEARRRGVRGVSEPVYYQGEKVGAVQRYSDTLLMFLIKKERPAYRETQPQQQAPEAGKPRIGIGDNDPRRPRRDGGRPAEAGDRE